VIDANNPTPAVGWANEERKSLTGRAPADLVLALALIHHLSISNNLPFLSTASYFSSICTSLVIEFIPKSDSQVQRLLVTREDIFTDYNRESFEKAFGSLFNILSSETITGTERVLYQMKRK
jgi:hypothetical protein